MSNFCKSRNQIWKFFPCGLSCVAGTCKYGDSEWTAFRPNFEGKGNKGKKARFDDSVWGIHLNHSPCPPPSSWSPSPPANDVACILAVYRNACNDSIWRCLFIWYVRPWYNMIWYDLTCDKPGQSAHLLPPQPAGLGGTSQEWQPRLLPQSPADDGVAKDEIT